VLQELANRMAATYGRVDFLYMNAGRACRAWRNLTALQYCVPAMGSMNLQRSGGGLQDVSILATCQTATCAR